MAVDHGPDRIYVCEVLLPAGQAALLVRQLETTLGGPCPCRAGRRCPLLPVPLLEGERRGA